MKNLFLTFASVYGAILATFALWAMSSMVVFPWTEIDIHTGSKIFRQRCSSCHAADQQESSSFGPSLARIGIEAESRVVGKSAIEYLLESVVKPDAFRISGSTGEMPIDIVCDLSAEEILSVVGYLQTLGSTVNPQELISLRSQVTPGPCLGSKKLDFKKVKRGKEIFMTTGKCIDCHRLQELPGMTMYAPSLLQAANHSEQYLRTSILNPSHKITPGYEQSQMVLSSGKVAVGRILSKTKEGFELLSYEPSSSLVQRIAFEDLDDPEAELGEHQMTHSPMPAGYEKLLSEEDVDALVYFLKSLR